MFTKIIVAVTLTYSPLFKPTEEKTIWDEGKWTPKVKEHLTVPYSLLLCLYNTRK